MRKYFLKFHHSGCESCKKQFPEGKVPKHKILGIDLFSNKTHEWLCPGSGTPTVRWFVKHLSRKDGGVGLACGGWFREGWKPKGEQDAQVTIITEETLDRADVAR